MGLLDLFNKNKPNKDLPLTYYDVDIHSHLIPGIDDGSKSYEESFEIISFFKSLGVRKMITTPHLSFDFYQNKHEDILDGFKLLKEKVSNARIEMDLSVAAEYMIDDGFRSLINKGNLLTFGDNYLLIELNGFAVYPDFSSLIFDLQSSGYKIILAHPERYPFWHNHRQEYISLKERDVMFQMNALSLTNLYSPAVNKTARWLIENKMIDFIGSDVHHASQQALYMKALSSKLYYKLKERETIRNNDLL
jgi:protein-tyrosine phosphatase